METGFAGESRRAPVAGLWIGVDLGTSLIKALIMSSRGRVLSPDGHRSRFATVATPWKTDGTADPEAFVARVAAAIGDALGAVADESGQAHVEGLALTGFGESGVLIEPDGSVRMPVIPWYDRRGDAQAAALPAGLADEFVRRTGLFLDAQASVATLLWWQAQGHRVSPGSRWLSIPEWVAYRLGGEALAEPSLASRTGLLDIDAETEHGLFTEFLPEGLLPPLRRAGVPAGAVSGQAARAVGLPQIAGAVLSVAGHDHAVCALGAGCTGPDDLLNEAGTADVLVRSVPAGTVPPQHRGLLAAAGVETGCHAVPGRQVLIGGVRAGLTLRRLAALLGAGTDGAGTDGARDAQGEPLFAGGPIDLRAAELAAIPDDLEVVGVANDVDQVVIRLRDHASPEALWLAGARAAAAETARLLGVLEEAAGPHARAVATGGWTRSATVRRAKRDIMPHLTFSADPDAGATGAALIAGHAARSADAPLVDWIGDWMTRMTRQGEEHHSG